MHTGSGDGHCPIRKEDNLKQIQKTRGYRQPLFTCLNISNDLLMVACVNEIPVTSLVTSVTEPVPVAVETPILPARTDVYKQMSERPCRVANR